MKTSATTLRKSIQTLLLGGLVATLMAPAISQAIPLIDGFGGDAGFGELAMQRNDDGSSNRLALPFEINFFGQTHNSFFINNNGNISFNNSVGEFTPTAFPASNNPMIAPYWGDVDTRCSDCGEVYVASPNADTTIVTWNNVGFFASNSSKTNNFQLVLRNQGNGDFDIEFLYDRLQWTTGDFSGGSNGLGGIQAQAGFDAGDFTNFFTLPGSRTADVLDLQNQTNVVDGEDGFWSFAIRNGSIPGTTPDNPLLPVIVDNDFTFDFNVNLDEMIFIDPDVAIGYDFTVTSGPNMASVLLPTGFGDDRYDLQLFNGTEFVDAGELQGGLVHFFDAVGVEQFRILGIEENLNVDPTDPQAFVTGLTFVDPGRVQMIQTPITRFVVDANAVPVPGTIFLLGLGLLGIRFTQRRNA